MTERECWDKSYSLNVVSTNFFTKRFVPLLLLSTSPRLVFVSSRVSSFTSQLQVTYPIDHSPAAGWPKESMFQCPAYRASKAALNMVALEWSRILKNDGVIVHLIDPGMMKTGFGGVPAEQKPKHPSPSISAEFIKETVEGKHDEHKQVLLSKDGVVPW